MKSQFDGHLQSKQFDDLVKEIDLMFESDSHEGIEDKLDLLFNEFKKITFDEQILSKVSDFIDLIKMILKIETI